VLLRDEGRRRDLPGADEGVLRVRGEVQRPATGSSGRRHSGHSGMGVITIVVLLVKSNGM
jgi:hypothetical protein